MSANQVAVLGQKPSVVRRMAERFGVDPDKMLTTLKATVFRGEVSNEQLMMLLVVADQHGLSPFNRELFAFPSQNGIIPCVSIDGWLRLANENPNFKGMTYSQSEEIVTLDDAKPCPAWMEVTIHRKDREFPTVVREHLDEVYRPPYLRSGNKIAGPWQTHTKRMLRWKTTIQGIRVAFSMGGLYDEDEAGRILEAEAVDVTPTVKISPKRLKELAEGMLKAVEAKDRAALTAIYDPLSNDERQALWPHMRSYERSGIKALLANKAIPDDVDIDAWSVTALQGAKTGPDLLASYSAIEGAYADRDMEVPLDIQTLFGDLKQSLAVP